VFEKGHVYDFAVKNNNSPMSVVVVRPETILSVDMVGLQAVAYWLGQFAERKPTPLCVDCDFEFIPGKNMPTAFVVLHALKTKQALVSPVCKKCAQMDDQALCRAAAGRIFDNIRVIADHEKVQ
jgi:hypothetical protein